jgi:hypothetical protein
MNAAAAADADQPTPATLPATNGERVDGAPATVEALHEGVPGDPGGPDTSAADLQLIVAALAQVEPASDVSSVEPSPTRVEPPPAPEPQPELTDLVIETSFVPAPTGEPLPHLPEPVCVPATTANELTAFFDGGRPMIGADYQRAFPLPGGRVLWIFQDAFLPTSHGRPQLVHNVGLLQSGQCFQLLHNGSADAPTSYLFPELTDRYDRWFWPLGGDIGTDGDVHVFVAEMIEHGGGYLAHTEPIATWLVKIDVDDLSVVDMRLAPDQSPDLYGWSVVSAGEHTYLYSHCYRQFGYDPLWFDPSTFAHDLSCTADVTVARIPRGEFEASPRYWDGTYWVADRNAATAVIPGEDRSINPTQVALLDGRFLAVTKVGDWWGTTILLDVADAPQGPWSTVDTIPIEKECEDCNTYFASIVPYGADADSFIVGLSCNTFGDEHDHGHYTPTFLRVRVPTVDGSAEAELHDADPGELRT